MKRVKLGKTDKTVEAYTERDLAKELHEQTNLSLEDSKLLVLKMLDLLQSGLVRYDAVLLRNLFKLTKTIMRTKIHYHTKEHFDMLKRGEIKNLKEVKAKVKETKPFYRIKLSLAAPMKEKFRDVKVDE